MTERPISFQHRTQTFQRAFALWHRPFLVSAEIYLSNSENVQELVTVRVEGVEKGFFPASNKYVYIVYKVRTLHLLLGQTNSGQYFYQLVHEMMAFGYI